jgi:transposase
VGTLNSRNNLTSRLTWRYSNGYTNAMYIRTVKNNSGQAYHQLVESFRDQGQVKKRVLLTLGKVEDHKIEDLAEAIRRHQKQLSAYDLAKKVSIEDTFILGPLWVLKTLFERLGINEVLAKLQAAHPQLGFNLRELVFSMAACRFMEAGSKLKVYDYWIEKFYPKMIQSDMQLHQIYRAVSLLGKHKEEIEGGLYRHGKDLFNRQVDVVLYDLTTLRFESTRTDLGHLRQFGYSKEMRTDCTQVVFGLLVDTDGIPLGFEVYPGNTFEGKTLKDMVEKMRKKFQVRRFIFVADRGLFSKKNLEWLMEGEGEFIVGMKLGILKKRHDELLDLSKFKEVHESFYVRETEYEGHRCVITWSKVRYERDQKARADIVAKVMKKIAAKKIKPEKWISNRGYGRYVKFDGQSRALLNEDAIREDEKRDGFYGVLTNAKDLSAQEVIGKYKELWKIEDAFGEIKGKTLRARPVFHWTDERIVGHLTLCFLAYLCEAHMTKVLREKGKTLKSRSIQEGVIKERALTVSEAMRELCQVRAIPIQWGDEKKKKRIWIRTDINGNAAKLMTALGLQLPPRVLAQED